MRRPGTYSVAKSRARVDLQAYWRVLYALAPDERERRALHEWLISVDAAPPRAKWPGYFPERWRGERKPVPRPPVVFGGD